MTNSTAQAERLALAQERIEGYQQISNSGGRNGAIVLEVGRLAGDYPTAALDLAEAITIDDPSLGVNCLAVVGHEAREVAPLEDARAITEGLDLTHQTRDNKLSRIAIYGVGIDNRFAADTAQAISSPRLRSATQDHLSLTLSPMMKRAIEEDRLEELESYHDLVFRALGLGRNGRIDKPFYLHASSFRNVSSLDPIRHGGRFLEAVAPGTADFNHLVDLIGSVTKAEH